jgi:hypothetical protein
MSKCSEAIRDAKAAEAEAFEGVEAAQAEQQRGEPGLSFDLLIEAIGKERDSLDLLEQGIETLHQSIEDRRTALEKQEGLLHQLMDELNQKLR